MAKKEPTIIEIFDAIKSKINKKFVTLSRSYFENGKGTPFIFKIQNSKGQIIHKVMWNSNAKIHDTASNEEITMIFDPDFSLLRGLLANPKAITMAETLKYPSDQKSMFVNAKEIFNFLTLKNNKNEAFKLYQRIYHIGIKNSIIENFKIKVFDPYKRFYLFDADDLRPQYSKSPFKLKSGDEVMVNDSTALCFVHEDGSKSIDFDTGYTYSDKHFFYVGVKWKFKEVLKVSKTKGSKEAISSDGKTTYYERVAPSKAEIKANTIRKIPYYSVDNQFFKLLIKGKKIYLVDSKGEQYHVTHNDLGVELLNK